MQNRPNIYLAGPQVFIENPERIFTEMKEICATHDFNGVAPIDNQLDLTGIEPGKKLGMKIVCADIDLMNDVDGGIFCVDSWRGVEMDTGTAIECGYMHGLGKPMVGWATDTRSFPEKTIEHYGGAKTLDNFNAVGATSGSDRAPDGSLIHSDGFIVHGMAEGFIELSGGSVQSGETWQEAFTNALKNLKPLLS